MKVSAKGKWPLPDIASRLAAFFESMSASGIDGLASTTLYVTPYSMGKPTHFLDERGTAIEALDIMPTRRMVKETFIWQDYLKDELDVREYQAKLRKELDWVTNILAETDGHDVES